MVGSPDRSLVPPVAVSLARSFNAIRIAVGLSVAAVVRAPAARRIPPWCASRRRSPPGARAADRVRVAPGATSQSTFFAVGMAVFFLFFAVEFGVAACWRSAAGARSRA